MDNTLCANCKHMTIERHEDYMGQPCWYFGKCDVCIVQPKEVCAEFKEGKPKKKDCRVEGDW